MVMTKQIKQKISSFPEGYIFTLSDFKVDSSDEMALAKLLSRMTIMGELKKVSKGKYYKPQETAFGVIKPSYEELVKDFLMKDGKTIGYITGAVAFSSMGLTTQISSNITIGTNKYRHPLVRDGYKINFLRQDNTITSKNIELLQILDALKLVREISGTSPDEACRVIIGIVASLPDSRIAELEVLTLKYTNYVRALMGAIMEYLDKPFAKIRKSLNGISSYYLPISDNVLPTKLNWRIYESARK